MLKLLGTARARTLTGLILALLAAASCAPTQPTPGPRGDAPAQAAAPVSAPKTLTIAMNREPTGFGPHQATDTNLYPLFLATLIKYRVWDNNF
ncbi:MAG: hypothetical protein QOF51_2066, partial [Chloroflexota bacterium]|nr:hypothetical protein [Chloroflexota bacterium]